MKVRSGFVSNSSTSSFIVGLRKVFASTDEGNLISKDTEKILFDYGFRYTCSSAESIEMDVYDHSWRHDEPRWSTGSDAGITEIEATRMGHFVVCNEDWVYRFLIDNGIPFESMNHYGHYHLWWDGKSDFVIRACNFGLAYDFAVCRDGGFADGIDKILEGKDPYGGELPKPFEKIPITYWTEDKMLSDEEEDNED